ncbi:SCO4225 family membrane protein [Streptomyces sp. C10]|uniref:SCO4225 family membrane protein n=1 Tax=Streptomyces sp. C10 TaxID=531941 RepID=UPI0039806A24
MQEAPNLLGKTMNSGRLRSMARVTFGNRVSQAYLALIAVATVFLLLGGSVDDPAGFWVLLVAMPTILVMLLAEAVFSDFGSTPSWIACTSAVASVLIQSWFIGTIVSLARTGQWLPARPQAE